MHFEIEPKTLAAVVTLAALWAGELSVPFYKQFETWTLQLRHDGRNLFLGLFNALTVSAFAAATLAAVNQYAQHHTFGLVQLVSWPVGLELLVALLLFDFLDVRLARYDSPNPSVVAFP